MKNRLLVTAAPFIFLILWSAGYAVAKLGLNHAPPMTILALRYGSVLAILMVVTALLRPPFPQRSSDWFHIAFVGFLIQVCYFAIAYAAFIAGMPAGTFAIIVCLQPILVALAAPKWVGERVSRWGWVGLVLGLAGAVLAVWARGGVAGTPVLGLILSVVALLAITGGTLWEKRFGGNHHPVASNLIQYAVGTALTLPAAYLFEDMVIRWNGEFILIMAYLIFGTSLLAMTLLLAMIRAGEVARVSALFYLVPALAALFAWPILGEAMPPLAWAGMALAGVGVLLVQRKSPPKPAP
jgi:drug/metabolite transporter (DMT)-like permease